MFGGSLVPCNEIYTTARARARALKSSDQNARSQDVFFASEQAPWLELEGWWYVPVPSVFVLSLAISVFSFALEPLVHS